MHTPETELNLDGSGLQMTSQDQNWELHCWGGGDPVAKRSARKRKNRISLKFVEICKV